MRVRIIGTVTNHTSEECFLPSTLWFATKDCNDNLKVSEDCCCLEGGLVWSSHDNEGSFMTDWEQVSFFFIDNDGTETELVDPYPSDVLLYWFNNSMEFSNMDASLDHDCDVVVDRIILSEDDGSNSLVLRKRKGFEPVEFIL